MEKNNLKDTDVEIYFEDIGDTEYRYIKPYYNDEVLEVTWKYYEEFTITFLHVAHHRA